MSDPYYTADNYLPCNSVGYLVKRLHKRMHALMEDALSGDETNFTQWVALSQLNSGIMTASELARDAGHDAGAMTRIVDNMEARGMITRERDTADRRIVNLRITDIGKAQFEALTPQVILMCNELLDGFEVEEIDAFLVMLKKLLKRLDILEGRQ